MGVASCLATLADLAIFASMFRLLGSPLAVATSCAALVGAIIHFSICKYWVFGRFDRSIVDSAWRYALVSGTALIAHTALTTFIASLSTPELGWLMSKGLVFAAIIYPASRFFVFGSSFGTARRVASAFAQVAETTED